MVWYNHKRKTKNKSNNKHYTTSKQICQAPNGEKWSSYVQLCRCRKDVKESIKNEIDLTYYTDDENNVDWKRLENKLNDDLFAEDSVTGNASGSYTFSRYQAKENVVDNIDLLLEMVSEFGMSATEVGQKLLDEDWEFFDVPIRCYILPSAISDVIEQLEGWILKIKSFSGCGSKQNRHHGETRKSSLKIK